MTTLVSFIIVIGIIIFVHELGHFLAAKLSGVRVEVFSLGFPPKLISRKVGETEYQIAWIPLGGYVKMSGMLDESFDKEDDRNDPRGFIAQSLPKRVLIITAGVIMNFILAFFIFFGLIWSDGIGVMSSTVISDIATESPAAIAGMQAGDRVIDIAGTPVDEWAELTETVRKYPGIPIEIQWLRGDSILSAIVTPSAAIELNIAKGERDTVGKLGVYGTLERKPVGPLSAAGYGIAQVGGILYLNVISIKMLVSGSAGVKDLTGPLGIAKMSGDSARSGGRSFLSFIALISVSIGFLNILPIPMLDGGHLVFILIEALIRRPIPENIKINLMKAGLAALLLLIVVVSYHDILKIFIGK